MSKDGTIGVWVELVRRGKKTIDEVPADIREEVRKRVEGA